jgi:penicillin-binding protein-related factor A (putative recombinase)
MNEGKRFEHEIENSVPEDVWFYRIKDSATSFGGDSGSRFTSDSRYDCLMWDITTKQLYGFELKSSKETGIGFADRQTAMKYEDMVNDLKWYKEEHPKPDAHQKEIIKRKEENIKEIKKELKGHSIKWHQIHNLDVDQQFGLKCAFLFQFRKTNNTYCFPINKFLKFWATTSKKSINEKDVIDYGGFLIPFTQKKVTHTYDLRKMIDFVEKEANNT